jgi:hypothetical protein
MDSGERPVLDPVLTYQQCADDEGVHITTWRRHVLPYIETVAISPRRRGVRRSVHEASKRARSRPPARRLEDHEGLDVR